MTITEMLAISLTTILIENFVLVRFLGICPFLGTSKKVNTAAGMGMAVIFVMTAASAITWGVDHYLLLPFELGYLRTVAFILVIAALVQLVEMALQKMLHGLYQALGIYLPLITTNCAVLGVTLLNTQTYGYDFIPSVFFGFAAGVSFLVAIVILASLRERMEMSQCPKSFEGFPITLVAAGLLSMAFMGFKGLKIW